MVRAALLLLTLLTATLINAYGQERVCLINSYPIPPAKKLEELVKKKLNERRVLIVKGNCSVRILIGTPAVVESLKGHRDGLNVYTFVLFPEVLGLNRKKNYYGVRIFPLPKRTVLSYFRKSKRRLRPVVVPVSKEMERIAKLYLPRRYFKVVTFREDPSEVFRDLLKYRYVYIFPDPKLLRVVNLLTLLNFGKKNRLVFLTGLPDLSRYGVDFVEKVDYDRLAEELVELATKKRKPKARVLPCPVER